MGEVIGAIVFNSMLLFVAVGLIYIFFPYFLIAAIFGLLTYVVISFSKTN